MSITQLIDRTAISPKIKQFFWDVKDRRTVPRGIGGYYNVDTTAVTNNTGATATVKTYTFTSSANTNAIRVRVYGSASSSTLTYTFYLLINGTQVATGSTSSISSVLVIDYIGSLTPNTNYTIQVQVTNGGYVNQVTIIAGFGLTSTTAVNILTINLDPANDTYTLYANGNFVYQVGIRWWAKGNRKTTATATIVSNLVSEIQGYYSPTAADDGDSNVFLTLRTGNYATSFTISGNVGASGDVIIITEIYAQIVLRGNNSDSAGGTVDYIVIKETGIASVTSRHVTIDGSVQAVYAGYIDVQNKSSYFFYQSSASADLIVSGIIFSSNNSPEYIYQLTDGDVDGRALFIYVNIVIIGA